MSSKDALTQQELKRLIQYDPQTGLVKRLCPGSPNAKNGSPHSQGYVVLYLRRKFYKVHRLAWLYMTGRWPEGEIDHINGDRADNRFANLRVTDRRTNSENEHKARANSKTGLLGASPIYRKRKPTLYTAQIKIRGKCYNLGRFDTPEQAHQVYIDAKRRFHEGCTI